MYGNASHSPRSRPREQGMALIAAIAFLILFAMLGTAYVGYMSLEFDEAGQNLHDLRARRVAADGVYAAIGEIQSALAQEHQPQEDYRFELAAYRQEAGEVANYPQPVTVRVRDEAARVNVNFAPLPVLRALGLDEDTLQALDSFRANPENGLLVNVDALRTQDLMNPQKFQALDKGALTVYTAEDPRQPHSYVNLNTASPRVLSALFAIDVREARELAAKRPFQSWADVLQKVGREPASFNVPVPRYAPRDMPESLAFASNCYRIASRVEFDMPGVAGRTVTAAVEAVVLFHDDGTYTIRYWKERRGAAAEGPAATPELGQTQSVPGEVTAPQQQTEDETSTSPADTAPEPAEPRST